ncbi:CRISPR-associated endonuclease Cas2 [Fimbriiglobus ruber]|uniref:CRISPR-associated endoribonuclease Cas2 n=1 Tax=Fimbriiglobus ruber TaxID=1908690 RepID=A0A225DYC9_9BACT|nr:CRISPR-associated endonuclease Cas2 [Fimbriiglobus ruber]OWK41137.1 CRISPR-associated endonuclease Cas2 [Fimbriiglobus ruber]
MPTFLIAYDIAHPRRLRRVARELERRAVRVQYSVFVFRGDDAALAGLMTELRKLVSAEEDVVQAWPVPPGVSPERFALGAVRPVNAPAVVVAGATRFVPRSVPPPTPPGSS